MTTVAISDKYVDVLSALGDVESAVDLALQRYTIEQITARIGDLRRRDATYRAKYGMEYATFARRAAAEESFIIETSTILRVRRLQREDFTRRLPASARPPSPASRP
jgi:lipase chaperone LimK